MAPPSGANVAHPARESEHFPRWFGSNFPRWDQLARQAGSPEGLRTPADRRVDTDLADPGARVTAVTRAGARWRR